MTILAIYSFYTTKNYILYMFNYMKINFTPFLVFLLVWSLRMGHIYRTKHKTGALP